jgi:hypothetical protein
VPRRSRRGGDYRGRAGNTSGTAHRGMVSRGANMAIDGERQEWCDGDISIVIPTARCPVQSFRLLVTL